MQGNERSGPATLRAPSFGEIFETKFSEISSQSGQRGGSIQVELCSTLNANWMAEVSMHPLSPEHWHEFR